MLNITDTQEQELLSDYYALYMQFCMNNSADNFYNER